MRPFTALTAGTTALHHGFEVNAGVGLVWEPFVGRRGALLLWGTGLPAWAAMALSGDERFDRPLALNNGLALAGGIVHFVLWPWELRRGVPALTEAEGMTRERLPAYNRVLYAWIATSALALALETPRRARPWALLGLAMGEPLRQSALHHSAGRASRRAASPSTGRPCCATSPARPSPSARARTARRRGRGPASTSRSSAAAGPCTPRAS